MSRAEIEAQIALTKQLLQKENAIADAIFQEHERIELELRNARRSWSDQKSKAQAAAREIDRLQNLLADADLPQFPVLLSGKNHRDLVIVRKTTTRIYVRFAGLPDYSDWIGSKGTHVPESWTLDVPAFLAWAKEQQA